MSARRAAAVAAALAWLAAGVDGAGAAEYRFRVLRDGDPIGEHTVRVERDCDRDRVEVAVATDLEVKLGGLLPLYRFEHHRREVWEDGRPVWIEARTDDDGKVFEVALRPKDDGLVRVVNGRAEEFGGDVRVLTYWNRDILRHESFVSPVNDETLDLSFRRVGREEIRLGGRTVAAERYRMTGDEERDIWYGPDGRVVKVALERRGSEIEFVLAAEGSDGRPAC